MGVGGGGCVGVCGCRRVCVCVCERGCVCVRVLACNQSVLPPQAIANATLDKYEIKTTPNKTTLSILDLDMEQDMGDYECQATSELGMASDKIHLRVRSRLAALWPFLGIVAEVIILVTIIFIYEKRRTPDEISDGTKQY